MKSTVRLKQWISQGLRFLTGRSWKIFPSLLKSPLSFGDKIIADAVMLAEIPSPSRMEEQRARFVLDRLVLLGVESSIDKEGNIFVHLLSAEQNGKGPLLFFTDLGSNRWHSVNSFSQLDAVNAKGAGLADVLGTAALLFLIEGIVRGRIITYTDSLFLFSAHAFDDPQTDSFHFILNHDNDRPSAAFGVQGFSLGTIINRPQGNYQLELKIVSPVQNDDNDDDAKKKNSSGPSSDNQIVDVLLIIAKKLSLLDLGYDNGTHCHIRRIEGGAGFGSVSSEGMMEVEIDSDDASSLANALRAVEAAIETVREKTECTIEMTILSHIPAGISVVSEKLVKNVINIMKDLHIKVKENEGADPASFLLNNGIPSLSLGIAKGRVGLEHDVVDIASVEKGRHLLENIIGRLLKEPS
jgi:hypothetical protein